MASHSGTLTWRIPWTEELGGLQSDTTERLSLSYGIRSHQFMANRGGKSGRSDISFSRAPKSLRMVTADMKLKDTCSFERKL